MTIHTTAPSYDVDFYSDDVIKDPYPHYARMRALGPVVWLPANGVFAVTRYEEVTQALRSPKRFISSKGLSLNPKVNQMLVGSTLNSDPPEHDRTRAVTSAPLLPGALKTVEDKIHNAAETLINGLVERGEFDAVTDFSQYLPLTIVAELVGLPDAGRANMLKWASATFNLFGSDNERSKASMDDLKDLRRFLDEYGHPDKLKEGGWAKRIFEVGPSHGISLERCAQLMRDYINPSLDTTISSTAHAIKLFAENPDQWQLIRKNPDLISNAVEEVVRLEPPIRAFSRYVAEDAELGGVHLNEGDRILVLYGSANRDESKYPQADQFDVTRDNHNHVGFGHGVHMCMGMHLARLEITTLLRLLAQQVERIELTGEPVVAMNNTIRAYASLPVRVHRAAKQSVGPEFGQLAQANQWIDMRVSEREHLAPGIDRFVLKPVNSLAPLQAIEPGAHIDVYIRDGLIRQYSLINKPGERDCYQIAVLKEADSRGGSISLHEECIVGTQLKVSRPKNHFPLANSKSPSILLAGGIGITPLLAMAHYLAEKGLPFTLHYFVRSRENIAFSEELSGYADSVVYHIADEGHGARETLPGLIEKAASDVNFYSCGPSGFMEFIRNTAKNAGFDEKQVHQEYFGAEIDTDGDSFLLELARSGKTIEVKPNETMADALAKVGIEVTMSCQSGVCGTCLTKVISGTPDHRDLVQTDSEKASNQAVTVCCSRSRSKKMVLDL